MLTRLCVVHVLQVLAAEKAGCWSAALTLYEQALRGEAAAACSGAAPSARGAAAAAAAVGAAQEQGRLSAAKRGHLNCLLQLGHLESLLVVVDGWSSRCTGVLPQTSYVIRSTCEPPHQHAQHTLVSSRRAHASSTACHVTCLGCQRMEYLMGSPCELACHCWLRRCGAAAPDGVRRGSRLAAGALAAAGLLPGAHAAAHGRAAAGGLLGGPPGRAAGRLPLQVQGPCFW